MVLLAALDAAPLALLNAKDLLANSLNAASPTLFVRGLPAQLKAPTPTLATPASSQSSEAAALLSKAAVAVAATFAQNAEGTSTPRPPRPQTS